MNKVQRAITAMLKERTCEDSNPLGIAFTTMDDNETARYVFSNYRGLGVAASGLHLTDIGLQLMK